LRNLYYSAVFLNAGLRVYFYKGPFQQSDSLCWAKDLQVPAKNSRTSCSFSFLFLEHRRGEGVGVGGWGGFF
jgi:hypothetical protein